MISQKYAKEFISLNEKEYPAAVKRILAQEENTGILFLEWQEKELKNFLKSFESLSIMSLSKYYTLLKKFADFICKKEGLPKTEFPVMKESNLIELIDLKALLKITLDYEQYQTIRRQLIESSNTGSVRDLLIFELAWNGLTNDEIRILKKQNVEFKYDSDLFCDIALIHIPRDDSTSDKVIPISDPDVVENIKRCMEEQNYIVESTDGRTKKMSYSNSDYLIRPVIVGKSKKEDFLANPSLKLSKSLVAKDITCEGIDIFELSVEDIRRSRIIYLLSPENHFDVSTVLGIYEFKNDSNIYWLRMIAIKKYGKKS